MESMVSDLKAREILDSRGYPTLEVELTLDNTFNAFASVPSGASTGQCEAWELRDNDLARFAGKGVLQAIKNTAAVFQSLKNKKFASQNALDSFLCVLDGTDNKKQLGANTLLGISMAFAKACAKKNQLRLFEHLALVYGESNPSVLPLPFINVLNGGVHASNNLAIQEFMLVPHGATSFKEALRMGCEVFYALKDLLKTKNLATGVGDEGGFAPSLSSHQQAIEFILAAIEKAGFVPQKEVSLALDVAANEIYQHDHYHLNTEHETLDSEAMIDYLSYLVEQYPIISIEDGLSETDTKGWQHLTKRLGHLIQLVGDDVFVTNPKRLQSGIENHMANAILIKPNQIGTITETFEAIRLAKKNGYKTMISHRSGETEDTFIADLAVATSAKQIKTGSVCRSERLAKYNQLLRIEEYLSQHASFARIVS